MTTESKTDPRASGGLVLLGAGAAALVVTAVATGLGALVEGGPGALGALTGSLLATVVLAFGLQVTHVVTKLQPELSLVVALMTYGLQLAMVTAVLAGLSRSGALGSQLDASWTVGGVVAAVLVWASVQVALYSRLRIPLYDLREPRAGTASSAPLSTPARVSER